MKYKNKIGVILSILLILLITNIANANVNLKNGNFFLYNTDFVVNIDRTSVPFIRFYNSRLNYSGIFGEGWTFNFMSFIKYLKDNTYLFLRSDGGFVPLSLKSRIKYKKYHSLSPSKAEIAKIISLMKKEDMRYGSQRTDEYYASMAKKMAKDPEFFEGLRERFGLKKKNNIHRENISTSHTGYNKFSLERNSNGFILKISDGSKMYFNLLGQLIKKKLITGDVYKIIYKRSLPYQIIINDKIKIHLYYNNKKLVSKIMVPGKGSYRYQYNSYNILSKVIYPDNKFIEYRYDKKHRLYYIKYFNGKFIKIKYSNRTGWVKEVQDNRNIQKFSYFISAKQYGYTKTIVEIPNGNKLEYIYKNNRIYYKTSDGKSITINISKNKTIRTKTDEKGIKEIYFYDKLGRLTSIQKGKIKKVLYKYRKNGRLPYEIDYPIEERKIILSLDKKGNILSGKDNKGNWFKLIYNKNYQLISYKDSEKRHFTCKYDISGKAIINKTNYPIIVWLPRPIWPEGLEVDITTLSTKYGLWRDVIIILFQRKLY